MKQCGRLLWALLGAAACGCRPSAPSSPSGSEAAGSFKLRPPLNASCPPSAAASTPPAVAASTPPAVATAAAPDPAPPAASPAAAADPAKARETTFDDLKFAMEIGAPFSRSLLTPQVESLFGQRIRLRGYLLPTLRKRGLQQFVLVRDNMECCFGPGAALYDCVLVTMAEGQTAEFTIRPVAVEGVFDFEEHAPLGTTLAIYKMTADSVE